jgi:hypothetical protein
MSKTITVQIRSVYGRETVYPACPDAVRFAELAGAMTLTPKSLRLIEALGYTIEVEAPAIRRAA